MLKNTLLKFEPSLHYILSFLYIFLSNSFIYNLVHTINFLFNERKAISCLYTENPPALELLDHFTKSSTVVYKQVA